MDTFDLVDRLLSTNTAPSIIDAQKIRATIALLEHAVKETLDAEGGLPERLAQLQDQQLKHRAALLPIRSDAFPSEMLAEIFVQVVEPEEPPLKPSVAKFKLRRIEGLYDARLTVKSNISPRRAPLPLSWVCRSWRDIALSTPSLWRELHLELCRPSSKSHRDNGAILAHWLERSGSGPIDLVLTPAPNINGGAMGDPAPFLEQVAANIHRFRNLTITIGFTPEWKSDWTLPSFQVTQPLRDLRRVHYGVIEKPRESKLCLDWMTEVISAEHSPNLRELVWIADCLLLQLLTFPSLTKLVLLNPLDAPGLYSNSEFQGCTPLVLHLVLRNTPQLEFCSAYVHTTGIEDDTSLRRSGIALSKLNSLELSGPGLFEVLRVLTSPSLTRLDLTQTQTDAMLVGPWEESVSSIWGQLERSSCQLTHLTMRGIPIDVFLNGGKGCFRLLDRVTTLDLQPFLDSDEESDDEGGIPPPTEAQMQAQLLRLLTVEEGLTPFCPSLESLSLRFFVIPWDEPTLFEEMLRSRTGWDRPRDEEVEELQSLFFEAAIPRRGEDVDDEMDEYRDLTLPESLLELIGDLNLGVG